MPVKVVYITCLGHSGSTLLNLMLGAHSEAVSVGSLRRIADGPKLSCSCGAKRLGRCGFWSAVDAAIRARSGLGLADLDIEGSPDSTFAHHNRLLYEGVAEVSGKSYVIDSSKSPQRLQRLLNNLHVTIYPIHLVRPPQGVVYSQMRKGRSLLKQALRYGAEVCLTRAVVRRQPHIELDYEMLARDPESSLTRVMSALGLTFEAAQLEWAGLERHLVGGNRMRDATDPGVRLDNGYRDGLSTSQKWIIELLAAPARVGSRARSRGAAPSCT